MLSSGINLWSLLVSYTFLPHIIPSYVSNNFTRRHLPVHKKRCIETLFTFLLSCRWARCCAASPRPVGFWSKRVRLAFPSWLALSTVLWLLNRLILDDASVLVDLWGSGGWVLRRGTPTSLSRWARACYAHMRFLAPRGSGMRHHRLAGGRSSHGPRYGRWWPLVYFLDGADMNCRGLLFCLKICVQYNKFILLYV